LTLASLVATGANLVTQQILRGRVYLDVTTPTPPQLLEIAGQESRVAGPRNRKPRAKNSGLRRGDRDWV